VLVGKDVFIETGVYDWETGRAETLEVPLGSATAPLKAAIQDQPRPDAEPN
jgi:hypothetical protein